MKDKMFTNKIKDVMDTAMDNLKPLIDSNVIIGDIIKSGDMQIVPLTKVSLGFVSGGGEYYSELKEMRRETEYPFSGGCGGGVSVQPIGFLVIRQSCVELIKIDQKTAIEKLIEAIPELAKFIGKNLGKEN